MRASRTVHPLAWSQIPTGLLALVVGMAACGGPVPLGGAATGQATTQAPDGDQDGDRLEVRLDLLERAVPDVVVQARSPFQFDFGGSAPEEPSQTVRQPNDEVEFVAPSGPRPSFVAPIRLEMIGLVEGKTSTGRIAVLQDGDLVVHGRQGDIVDGRYRVLDVGPRSVEIERLEDGQRRVLRLPES